jgi:hypothetical protein
VAVDLGIFEIIKQSGPEGIRVADLATKTGANKVLIGM